jgi:type II secretory pathway pseudopilin PulG
MKKLKYFNKNAFSMLEMILSLILLSIVSTFIFRYINIFYTNYNQTKTLYLQNINLDRSMAFLNNLLETRILSSEIQSNKQNFSPLIINKTYNDNLEFLTKDTKASIGYYYNHLGNKAKTGRWQGYSGIIQLEYDVNKSIEQPITTIFSYLSAVDDMYRRANKDDSLSKHFMLLYSKDSQYKRYIGWYNSSRRSIFPTGCRDEHCIGDTYLMMNNKYFKKLKDDKILIDIIKKLKNILYYDIIDSAVAIVLEKKDLIMYNNYFPWKQETYKDGNRNIIIKNIKSFSFQRQNNTKIKIKICIKENICKSIRVK